MRVESIKFFILHIPGLVRTLEQEARTREKNMRIFLRSKIHKAIVTEANLHYVGSISIDERLLELADLAEYEKVLVVDNTNGHRLETYVIKGKRNSGSICMNGAAAHLIQTGDEVIIMSFQVTDRPKKPINILVDKQNHFVKFLREKAEMRDTDGC
jgi:aspartate 1-decarboxylase